MLGLSMALLVLATLMIQFLQGGVIPVAYGLLLGAAAGTGFAAEGVLYPRSFGVKAIASIRGLAFTVSVAAAAVGPIIVGVAHEATGDYRLAGWFLMAVPVAVGLLVLLVRNPEGPRSADALA
jgi:MFS-type transporter involved in bile tolerance (Atg22 family)